MAGKADDNQLLPAKEASLFRSLVRHYEHKQHKKATKAADQVLKKFPDHGETLAMKGLVLSQMGKREEAFELARRGLTLNMRSHVCWHVYGLLYRADNNYAEASKCYKNALRLEKENFQILRDLAALQVQTRDMAGLVETRRQVLHLKANNKPHWIGLAVAHHLNGEPDLCLSVLESYEATQDDGEEVSTSDQYEHSEQLLYKAWVLEESGKLDQALQLLTEQQGLIKDRLGWLEARARMLLQLGEAEAADLYRRLIACRPDNYAYYKGLTTALGLTPSEGKQRTDEQRQGLTELYGELQQTYSRANAPKRLLLDITVGQAFEEAAQEYVRPYLEKGVPSLFSDLKPLLSDPDKREALCALFEQLLAAQHGAGAAQANGAVPEQAAAAQGAAEPGDGLQNPQSPVWEMLYLALHYDHQHQTGKALEMLDRALHHTPTLIELHTARCKVLKHAGDPEAAAEAADHARSLDLADRYLNSQAAKALFRAGRIQQAERTATLFTRHGEQANSLQEMQCMWYEIECGQAHMRQRSWGKALKKLLQVSAHFDDFSEDQFDFHSYCIRKGTLRHYVELLRSEDRLRGHASFVRAACSAVEVYLKLCDAPAAAAQEAADADAQLAGLNPEERKKAKQKQRKEAAKKQRREEEAARAAADAQRKAAAEEAARDKADSKKKGEKATAKKEDADPDGAQLAATQDPLGEATKLLRQLQQHAAGHVRTHVLSFEVYQRKGRLLLALQAVLAALRVAGAAHPDAQRLVVRFCQAVHLQQQRPEQNGQLQGQDSAAAQGAPQASAAEPSPVVSELISKHVAELLGEQSLAEQHQQWAKQHASDSLQHAAAAAELSVLLHEGCRQEAAQQLASRAQALLDAGNRPATHADAVAVHELLATRLKDDAAAEQWSQHCQQIFRWSQYFNASHCENHQANGSAGFAELSLQDCK